MQPDEHADREVLPGFQDFAAYLKGQSVPAEPKGVAAVETATGCLFALSLIPFIYGFVASQLSYTLVSFIFWFVLGMLSSISIDHFKSKALEKEKFATNEARIVLAEVIWFEKQGTLDDRSHPQLVPVLDACAKAWFQCIDDLRSEAWIERAKEEKWRELRDSALESADGAMLSAIWAARKLFRRKGGRKTTFAKRCADPKYGQRAFARLELIKNEMEELANHVSDEVFTHPLEQSEIRTVLENIRHIHEAQEELDRDAPRLM